MTNQKLVASWFQIIRQQACTHTEVRRFLAGECSLTEATAFAKRLSAAHLRSPQILSFLYAVVPPHASLAMRENLCEEMGVGGDGEEAHPQMLARLGRALAWQASEWSEVEAVADAMLHARISEPLLFASLKEIGLGALLEVVAFEWFLAREASHFARALTTYFPALLQDPDALLWFHHHAEADIAHAAQGLATIDAYATHYAFDQASLQTIAEVTFRQNPFLKRYFDVVAELEDLPCA